MRYLIVLLIVLLGAKKVAEGVVALVCVLLVSYGLFALMRDLRRSRHAWSGTLSS